MLPMQKRPANRELPLPRRSEGEHLRAAEFRTGLWKRSLKIKQLTAVHEALFHIERIKKETKTY